MMRIKSSISSDSKEKLTEKAFKQSIILSFLSIFLCIVALCSTTFAWFTDEVSTGNNKIVSGALKIGLEYKKDWDDEWKPVDANTNIFKKDALYEPGYTEIVFLRISNAGNLALKYNLMIDIEGEEPSVNVNGEPFRLSDYLEIGTRLEPEYKDGFTCADLVMPLQFGNREDALKNIGTMNTLSEADLVRVRSAVLLPGEQTAQVMAIVLTMPEDLTNGEVNYDTAYNAPEIDLKIKAAAVQHAYESDSFDDQYDAVVVAEGTYGGVKYTLTDNGTLKIGPAANPAPDGNSGAQYESGEWREAVVYDSNGNAKAIGGYPYNVNDIKTLVIEDGVTSIGSFTAKFPNLTGEVVIPASVTYIGQEAFQNTSITKLTFAEGGTEPLCIAPGAFKKLDVEEIVFPADRPEIHIHCWAFNDCTSLKRITFPANVTTFSNWTHVEYCGMDFVDGYDSQILARCNALESITFGSQEVHDKFVAAPGNRNNVNAIGGVEIIVNN